MLEIADNYLQWIRYCCTKMVFLKEVKVLIKKFTRVCVRVCSMLLSTAVVAGARCHCRDVDSPQCR